MNPEEEGAVHAGMATREGLFKNVTFSRKMSKRGLYVLNVLYIAI